MEGIVKWAPTGQHGVVESPVNRNPAAGMVTVTEHVTGGLLAGDTLTFVGALVPSADCGVNGLKSLYSRTGARPPLGAGATGPVAA